MLISCLRPLTKTILISRRNCVYRALLLLHLPSLPALFALRSSLFHLYQTKHICHRFSTRSVAMHPRSTSTAEASPFHAAAAQHSPPTPFLIRSSYSFMLICRWYSLLFIHIINFVFLRFYCNLCCTRFVYVFV